MNAPTIPPAAVPPAPPTTAHVRIAEKVAQAYGLDPTPEVIEVTLEDIDEVLTDFGEADQASMDIAEQLNAYAGRSAKAEAARVEAVVQQERAEAHLKASLKERDEARQAQVAAEKRNVALVAIAREAISALEATRKLLPVDRDGRPIHPDAVAEGYADGLRAAVTAVGKGIER